MTDVVSIGEKRDFLREITLFSYKFITLQPNLLNFVELWRID